MTQDEKVALLRQAGVWDVIGFPGCIDKLIDTVAAHERELCAKVCDEWNWSSKHGAHPSSQLAAVAAAIRARGEK